MRKTACLLLAILVAGTSSLHAAEETISFGIVPQQSTSKLARLWRPVLDYLGDKSGVKLEFHTAPGIPEFEKRLYAGRYDISYMNPYHYTVAHERAGYEAFARQKDKRLVGILVTRKDSGISDVKQLAGSTLAFPSPAAFAASILPRAFLEQSGIDFRPRYVSSHDSVYRSVQLRLYPAGGGILRTLNSAGNKISDDLEILWQSRGYTPHAFAAHPRLGADSVAAITKAMLTMADDPAGKALLTNIRFKGIETGSDADWNDIRQLHIEKLQ